MRKAMFLSAVVLALAVCLMPATSKAQVSVGVSIRVGPPAIPVYEQPPCPVEGYLWTPGYWAYGPDGYYWVPGVWVAPPRPGFLWTPGYWGWSEGVYAWHAGYWGPHVGFYGGVNYGFGYGGVGFVGGEWRGGRFAYNTAVVRVNETVVHNVYVNKTVIVNNTTVNRVSYNGGPGGIAARPNTREMAAARETHVRSTTMQVSHEGSARADRSNWASQNHGRPEHAAVSRVNERGRNQQERIGQGVRSGQLTAGETRHVEHQEGNINREVRQDRAANGGHLTQQEREQVNRQQNHVSREINHDKHNDKTQQHPRGEDRPHGEERPHR